MKNLKYIKLLSLSVFISACSSYGNDTSINNASNNTSFNNPQNDLNIPLDGLLEADIAIANLARDLTSDYINPVDKEYLVNSIDNSLTKMPSYDLLKVVRLDMQYNSYDELLSDEQKIQREKILKEFKLRWLWLKERKDYINKIPKEISYISPEFPFVLVVDSLKQRMFLFAQTQDNTLELVRDYYITIGKQGYGKQIEGDQKTPLGTYLIRNYISPERIDPNVYGVGGAFPLDYPNESDKIKNRTGYGIWIHGTPVGDYIRTPYSSDGCISLSDNDFADLREIILNKDIPIIVAESLTWLGKDRWKNNTLEIKSTLDNWARDWSNNDIDRYISHYANSFDSQGKDIVTWYNHKKIVNSAKQYISVDLSEIIVLENPADGVLMSVFFQKYDSSNYKTQGYKRLFWVKEKQNWKIVFEGSTAPFRGDGLVNVSLINKDTRLLSRADVISTVDVDYR